MTTLAEIIAHDWLSQLSHYAFSAGATTALGGVCLVQYLWHLYCRHRSRQKIDEFQSRLEGLEEELADLHLERAHIQLENGVLQELLAESDPAAMMRRALTCFAGNGTEAFAAFLHTGPPTRVLHSAGLAAESVARLRLEDRWVAQLRQDSLLSIGIAEVQSSECYRQLAPQDRAKARELHLLSVPAPQADAPSVLLATALFPWSADVERRRQMSQRVIRAVARQLQLLSQTAAQDEELRIARDILELRSVLDAELRSAPELLEQFLTRLSAVTNFDQASLYLRRASEPTLHRIAHCRASTGNSPEEWRSTETQLVESQQSRPGLYVHERTDIERLVENAAPGCRQAVTISMRSEGVTMGVLCLSRATAEPMAPSEIELIQWSADHLLETIIRVADRALMEDLARHDALTGLANRHTFEQVLADVLERSQSRGSPAALILADIDRFKSINDTYGHIAGDQALKSVSAIIREECGTHLRGTDRALAARYGGEELAVILPGVNRVAALRVAERIRLRVRETMMESGEHRFRLTLSAGVSVTPDDATNAVDWLDLADRALYTAKQNGRDQVRAWNHEATELLTTECV
jgi:diguanylate cyclase (GGDEF)-like protein